MIQTAHQTTTFVINAAVSPIVCLPPWPEKNKPASAPGEMGYTRTTLAKEFSLMSKIHVAVQAKSATSASCTVVFISCPRTISWVSQSRPHSIEWFVLTAENRRYHSLCDQPYWAVSRATRNYWCMWRSQSSSRSQSHSGFDPRPANLLLPCSRKLFPCFYISIP